MVNQEFSEPSFMMELSSRNRRKAMACTRLREYHDEGNHLNKHA